MKQPPESELLDAIHGLFEGTLSPQSTAQLAERLAEDDELYALYAGMVRLDVGLAWSCGTRPKRDAFAIWPVVSSANNDASAPVSRSRIEPTKVDVLPIARLRSKLSFFSWPILQRVAVVALCFYGSFVLVAWNLRSFGERNPAISLRSHVQHDADQSAILTHADDASWKRAPSIAEPPTDHRTLQVHTGLAELRFADGAKVVVEGPAEFEVHAANRGFLRRGKLVATVPPQAIGFTIGIPLAEIVDLGTEFAVEVHDGGRAEVEVLQGKVVLKQGTAGSKFGVGATQILTAGTARQIEPAEDGGPPVVREIRTGSLRAHLHPETSGAPQIAVQHAIASSEYARKGRSVDNLINGSGLSVRGAHSSQSSGTMWHSDLGRVKGEYVLFDLGKLHRLKSVKIWNFNGEAAELYRFRGAKQVDIYVSSSGKGDPLSTPTEWNRVVFDCRLHTGTGTDSYDTPDVVPLANAMAQFVAIVFHDHLGTDPRFSNNPREQCVGLSEVQFFGVPADAMQTKP
jgi:hypothetical protein